MSNYENHTTRSLIVLVGIGLVAVLMGLPSHSFLSGGSTYSDGPVYTPGPSFETQSLNDRMLMSQTFRLDTGRATNGRAIRGPTLARLIPAIRQSFRRNRNADALLHGTSARTPVGWGYIEVRNTSDQPSHLVLSMPQFRCNRATLWVGDVVGHGKPQLTDRFRLIGTLRNNTPLGERFYPFFSYAFPFTVPPRTTVPVLLRTQNYASFHEVNVRLSRQRAYTEMAFVDSIRDGINVVVFLLLAVLALFIGWLSKSQLLRWFSFYLLSLCVMCASHVGYLSLLPYPGWQSVNADTAGTLCRILINVTVHPFFYQMIKPAIRRPRLYKRMVLGYCSVCALLMVLHLLPLRYYAPLNYSISLGMVSVSVINMGWLLTYAVAAYRRAHIWPPLAICLLGLVPLIVSQIVSLIQSADQGDTYRQAPLDPLYIVFVLSYLTFEQFRRELVTRQQMKTQVRQVAEQNEALRRQEIEHIGRELHDQVGNTLATALGYLGRQSVDAQKLRPIILSAINEMRFLSHNLVKDDNRPLTNKVETLVSRFNDFSSVQLIYTDYTRQKINQLSLLKQQNLYRILQELLTNVIRHSGATQASVQFFSDELTVTVSVEDDGLGFDGSAGNTSGIGIQTVYQRAALSGITVQFDPAPTGTSILLQTTLDTPVPSHANPNYSY